MGKTAAELYEEARERLVSESKIRNTSPGTIARAILKIHTDQLGSFYSYVDNEMLNAYVSTSRGTKLDEIGKLVGVSRTGARYASGTIRFYIEPDLNMTFQDILDLINARTGGSSTSISLPSGTTVKTNGRSFVTTTDVNLTLTTQESTTEVLATLAGEYGNVQPGGIDTIEWPDPSLSVLQGILKVTNDEPIENGTDVQSDEDFRYYITNSYLSGARANETAIRLACLSVPGVADVQLQKYSYGIGTFSVFVLGSSPIVSTGTLQAVQSAINITQASGNCGVAISPDLIGLQMTIALSFVPTTHANEASSLTRDVQNVIVSYVNNLSPGSTMVINEVKQRAMDVSDLIHDMDITSVSIGTYDRNTGLITDVDNTIGVTNITTSVREKLVTNTLLLTVCHI